MTRDMCFQGGGTLITGDMCFPGREGASPKKNVQIMIKTISFPFFYRWFLCYVIAAMLVEAKQKIAH